MRSVLSSARFIFYLQTIGDLQSYSLSFYGSASNSRLSRSLSASPSFPFSLFLFLFTFVYPVSFENLSYSIWRPFYNWPICLKFFQSNRQFLQFLSKLTEVARLNLFCWSTTGAAFIFWSQAALFFCLWVRHKFHFSNIFLFHIQTQTKDRTRNRKYVNSAYWRIVFSQSSPYIDYLHTLLVNISVLSFDYYLLFF